MLLAKNFPFVFGRTAQSTSLQDNKCQTKPTQVWADAENGPWCYPYICFISINCSQSCSEVPFQEQSKPETLKPGLLCKMSKWFLRRMFKSSNDFIQFLFGEHLLYWSDSIFFFQITTLSSKLIYYNMSSFSVWNCNILKLMQEFSLTFHTNIIHEYSFQFVTLTCHFNTRNNRTDWMLNTVPGAWDYG
jgi:hypothetical protein